MVRLTGCLDMTIAVDSDVKPLAKQLGSVVLMIDYQYLNALFKFSFSHSEPFSFIMTNSTDSDEIRFVASYLGLYRCCHDTLRGSGWGVWYSLFIKNLAHYSSH